MSQPMHSELTHAAETVHTAETALTQAQQHRTKLILQAAGQGMSYRTIAKHVGLSSGRVGQILKENQQ